MKTSWRVGRPRVTESIRPGKASTIRGISSWPRGLSRRTVPATTTAGAPQRLSGAGGRGTCARSAAAPPPQRRAVQAVERSLDVEVLPHRQLPVERGGLEAHADEGPNRGGPADDVVTEHGRATAGRAD